MRISITSVVSSGVVDCTYSLCCGGTLQQSETFGAIIRHLVYARVSKLFKILSQMRERLHVAHVGEIRAVSSTAVKNIEIEC